MICKLLPSLVLPLRNYRPAVSPLQLKKILAIRSELAALGVATGRSRAKRNGMREGTSAVGMTEAIERLREAEKISRAEKGNSEGFVASLMLNIKVKLLKEQSNGFRGVLNLPNPELLNSRPSILVFASADQSKLATAAGANIVGGEELVPALIEGTLPVFNRCLATTSMLPTVMKVARILGPKGLMPNVKTGTLVDGKEIGEDVRNCLQSVPFKIEKHAGLLNMSLGSLSGSNEKLLGNVEAVIEHLRKMGGPSSGRYIERIYLSTRGHPGIQIKL